MSAKINNILNFLNPVKKENSPLNWAVKVAMEGVTVGGSLVRFLTFPVLFSVHK
jgi:hypothetical protein